MTIVNVTPTGSTNEDAAPEQLIDNMGNPIDAEGNPVTPATGEGEGETIESLQKALKDTKAELTRIQQEKAKKADEPAGGEEEEEPADDAQKAVEKSGLDFAKYSEEINTGGKLTEESYKELADKGFPKEIVDDYIMGQQARVDAQTKEVATVVGGEENLAPVLEWAAANLTAEEVGIYNSAVATGTGAAKLALQGIYARFVQANGKSPNLITSVTQGGASDVFKSPHEMTKAMQDPRYWNDPDYQKDIADKAERSQRAGTI